VVGFARNVQDLGQSTLILAHPSLPEAADPGRDLGLCRLQRQPAGLKVLDACQDQLGLVPTELPNLQRDHATLTVRKDTEGENRLHAKGGSRLESFALTDEQRIVDPMLGSVFLYRFQRIDGDTDNFKSICRMFVPKSLEQWNLPAARIAPGGPEIDDQGAAVPVRQAMNLAIGSREL